MSSFHLYRADCIGNAKNCLYPHAVEVRDAESLTSAVSRDYVAAEYQGGYRSDTRFLSSDCLALDCDNDHSEDPTQWVTPEIIMRLDTSAGAAATDEVYRDFIRKKLIRWGWDGTNKTVPGITERLQAGSVENDNQNGTVTITGAGTQPAAVKEVYPVTAGVRTI